MTGAVAVVLQPCLRCLPPLSGILVPRFLALSYSPASISSCGYVLPPSASGFSTPRANTHLYNPANGETSARRAYRSGAAVLHASPIAEEERVRGLPSVRVSVFVVRSFRFFTVVSVDFLLKLVVFWRCSGEGSWTLVVRPPQLCHTSFCLLRCLQVDRAIKSQ